MAMPSSGVAPWRVAHPSESPRPSSAKTRMEDSSIAGGTGGAKTEAELEAERIWWSEISERQVSQLETTFNAEFQRTCRALRSEIGASKDKLEMMVEEERQRREAGIAELKQLLEGQNAIMIAEVSQRMQNKQPAQEVIQDVRSELSFLQEDLQGTKTEWRRVSSLSAQLESMVRSLETEMGLQARRYDGLKELLPRVETLEDRCQQQSEPPPDYGPRLQVLSDELRMSKQAVATVIARADKLEEELRKATSEASPTLARVAELERKYVKLTGEAVPRIQDHLEALVQQERSGREGDIADLKIKVESQSAKIVPEEKLQTLVEQEKLRREAGIAELRSLVEGQAAMVTTEVRRQTQADQDKLQVMFAEEKSRRETGLTELRNLMDGQKTLLADMMIQQAQQRVAGGGPAAAGTPTPSTSSVATTGGADQSQTVGRLVCDVQDLRSQLVALKEEAQGAKAESRQSVAASSQLETLVHTLENDANRQAKLLEGLTHLRPRLETVEDKIQQQLASQPQVVTADGEAKAAQEAIAAVRSRTDQCEQGLRRFALDSSALTDRLKLIEGEVSSLSCEGVPLMKEVKILLHDFLTVAMMEAKARGDATPAPQPVVHTSVERQVSIKNSGPSMASSLMSPKPGMEPDATEEQHVTLLSSELKDLKLLLQHFQAAAAEFRYQPPKQPTRQNSSGSLSPKGHSSSVDWEMAPAEKSNKPSAVGELKDSIESLVSRMNETLVRNSTAPNPVASSSRRHPHGEPPPAASPAQQEQFRFMKALQAVRDLRERNVDLRGRNAELAELLSQDVPSTAQCSMQAPPGPVPERQATQGPFVESGSCRSPNTSPRIQGLMSGTTTGTGGTTPQGQQRSATLGHPGPASSFTSRAPSIGTGGTGPRTLSSQPTPQLRSPGPGRPGAGCPNPTPQLRAAATGTGGPGPGVAVTTAGSKVGAVAPHSSTLQASPLVLRQPGRVVPTTSSRPGPISR